MNSVAIVGSGAIGAFYGCMLARAGIDVRFLLRSDLAAVRREGFRILGHAGEFRIERPTAATTSAELGPVDLVIVAWKNTANHQLATVLPPLLHAGTAVLTLQNGLGNEETIAALIGAERVFGGVCFVGINRTAPGVIANPVEGSIAIGEFNRPAGPRLREIAALFERGGIKVATTESLAEMRWRKLIWNIPFNGLSVAAGEATTDDILGDDALRKLARDLMDEVRAIAAAEGHVIPAEFADYNIDRTYRLKAYKTSTLLDYAAGREIEIDAIWGEPVRRARALGVSAPRLEMLHATIRALAAKRRSI